MRPDRNPARIRVTRSVHNGGPPRLVELAAGQVRVDVMAVEDLGPVHVADPGDDGLVHQQAGDRRPAAGDAAERTSTVGSGRQGIRAEPVADRGDLRRAQHLARRRAAQVAPPAVGDPAHAHGTDRRGRRPVALLHLPEQPEVDVDDAVAERGEEVLAVGRHLVEHPSVDEGGVGEAALGAGHGDRTAGEAGALGARQAVQRVAFGHQRPAALPTRARGSAEAAKAPLGSTTMAWACPNPESNDGASATTWPRAASPRRQSSGA